MITYTHQTAKTVFFFSIFKFNDHPPAMWSYGRSTVWSGILYDILQSAATHPEGERSEVTVGCKAVSHCSEIKKGWFGLVGSQKERVGREEQEEGPVGA